MLMSIGRKASKGYDNGKKLPTLTRFLIPSEGFLVSVWATDESDARYKALRRQGVTRVRRLTNEELQNTRS